MIPYVEVHPITLGGLVIHPFGILVMTGCLIGFFVTRRHGKTRGLNPQAFEFLAAWTLPWGFALAHMVALAAYNPEEMLNNPWLLFKFKDGMSSFGGFYGGALAGFVYLRFNKLSVIEYGEAAVIGLTVGMFFGRLGCSLIHDHPGRHADFFLAVRYPDGPRHDLGFYEWLLIIAILAVIFFLRRRNPPAGVIMGTVCLIYAPVRFGLDFLRVADRLYFGLTPGQYFAMPLFAIGLWLLITVGLRDLSQARRS